MKAKEEVDHMAVITVGYTQYILPYLDGVEIMRRLQRIEKLEGYGDDMKITPVRTTELSMSILDVGTYKATKLKGVLVNEGEESNI